MGARIDPHIKVLNDRVVRLALERGLDAVVYAPHFTPWPHIVEQAERYTHADLIVVPAREIFTGPWNDRKHVLGLELTGSIPDYVSLEWTMDELERQDACVIAPHPSFFTMSLSEEDINTYRDVIDAVEVYNPKFLPWHTRRARTIAESVALPSIMSSYAHLDSSVGMAWIELTDEVTDATDVVDALRTGAIARCGRTSGLEHSRTKLLELLHLCWENTGQKATRYATPGTPETHPDNERYRVDQSTR